MSNLIIALTHSQLPQILSRTAIYSKASIARHRIRDASGGHAIPKAVSGLIYERRALGSWQQNHAVCGSVHSYKYIKLLLHNSYFTMPVERQPAQKRRQLPFKPPRPRASGSPGEGPSTSRPTPAAKPSTKGKTNQAPAPSSSSKPKQKRKSTGASTSTRKNSPPPAESPSESPASGSEQEDSSHNRERVPSEEPDYVLAEIIHGNEHRDVTTSEPAIPGKLLARLLHHNFQNEKTKIAKDANEVVAKYVDVFVREALARAAYERGEGRGAGGGGSIGDGFLEVRFLHPS